MRFLSVASFRDVVAGLLKRLSRLGAADALELSYRNSRSKHFPPVVLVVERFVEHVERLLRQIDQAACSASGWTYDAGNGLPELPECLCFFMPENFGEDLE